MPQTQALLQLPRDAVRSGPFSEIPTSRWSGAVVSGLRESFGETTSFLRLLAERAEGGAELFLDVRNAQSARELRSVIEGFEHPLDPQGSFADPERSLRRRALLEMLEATGFVVTDIYDVPIGPPVVGDPGSLALDLLEYGMIAGAFRQGTPPDRFWVTAQRMVPLVGSVLIGPGEPAVRQRTVSAVEKLLPPGWEIVLCPGQRELAAINRGVCLSRGEMLWLLRAGSVPSLALFEKLCAEAQRGPAVPAEAENFAGGLGALMVRRTELLAMGPLPTNWSCTEVGWEDFGLRLELERKSPRAVPGAIEHPGTVDSVDDLDAESTQLAKLWQPWIESKIAGPDPSSILGDQTKPHAAALGRTQADDLAVHDRSQRGAVLARLLGECPRHRR